MNSEDKRNDPLVNLIEIMLERKIIIIVGFLSVFCIVAYGAIKIPPSYASYSKIYISPPTLPRVQVPYIKEMAERTFIGNQIEVIKSRMVLKEVVKKFRMNNKKLPKNPMSILIDKLKEKVGISRMIPDPTERAISMLKRIVKVRLKRGTNVVTIEATTSSPKLSAFVANSVAETYIEFANKFISDQAENAYRYIEQEIENARRKLYESEKILNDFKRQENVISISNESNMISKKLTELDDENKRIQVQIERPNEQIDSQELKILNNQLILLMNQVAQLSINHTDEHPDVKIMRNRIANIENQIKQAKAINEKNQNKISIKELNELEIKRNYISKEIKKYLEKRSELAKKQIELDKKTREYANNQNRLNMLLAKLENADILIANEMKQGTIKILDQAVPSTFPYTKTKKILFSVGTVVAIIFGLGMAFIAEYLDDSIKTPNEVEQYLKIPVLGTVPKITRKLRRM